MNKRTEIKLIKYDTLRFFNLWLILFANGFKAIAMKLARAIGIVSDLK